MPSFIPPCLTWVTHRGWSGTLWNNHSRHLAWGERGEGGEGGEEGEREIALLSLQTAKSLTSGRGRWKLDTSSYTQEYHRQIRQSSIISYYWPHLQLLQIPLLNSEPVFLHLCPQEEGMCLHSPALGTAHHTLQSSTVHTQQHTHTQCITHTLR